MNPHLRRLRESVGGVMARSAHRALDLADQIAPPASAYALDWQEAEKEYHERRGDDAYTDADDALDRLIGRLFDLASALDEKIIADAEDHGISLGPRRAAVMRVSAALPTLREHVPSLDAAVREAMIYCSEATGLPVEDE
jgi:hypothetical protein